MLTVFYCHKAILECNGEVKLFFKTVIMRKQLAGRMTYLYCKIREVIGNEKTYIIEDITLRHTELSFAI